MMGNADRDRQSIHLVYEEHLERVAGIEPAYSAWKAAALPLSYTRIQREQPSFTFHLEGNSHGPAGGGGGWIRTSVRIANGFTVRLL